MHKSRQGIEMTIIIKEIAEIILEIRRQAQLPQGHPFPISQDAFLGMIERELRARNEDLDWAKLIWHAYINDRYEIGIWAEEIVKSFEKGVPKDE